MIKDKKQKQSVKNFETFKLTSFILKFFKQRIKEKILIYWMTVKKLSKVKRLAFTINLPIYYPVFM